MRGNGEPCFEHDFPPGSDMLADIREGPMTAERMEFELFGRLARYVESASEGSVGEKDDDDDDDDVTGEG